MIKPDTTILSIIEEADYDYAKVLDVVNARIAYVEGRMKQIEVMTDEEFMQWISKAIFGVALKGYYISQCKRDLDHLKTIQSRIDYMLDLWKRDRSMFNWVIRNSYKGVIRRAEDTFTKLAENKFTAKLIIA